MQHWQGNTDFTRHDMIQDMLRAGALSTGEIDITSIPATSVDSSLPTQISALMDSESYEDWLQAWELMRDHLPEDVTTFRECEVRLGLNAHGVFVNNLLYDLDIELINCGLDDLSLLAKRAEIARWVYTHFTEEDELTLGNFRGYEAESLWEMGQTEQAEMLFQDLIETFPNFAWGYIWWGDCYWMSDWSYENDPDYDRAESLYRQVLANPNLEDRGDVQDRLDDLSDEQTHPEKREQIRQNRLKRIQHRKNVG
jgi:tetratricopeptide (TPR) repeat protein